MSSDRKCFKSDIYSLLENLYTQTKTEYYTAMNRISFNSEMNSEDKLLENKSSIECKKPISSNSESLVKDKSPSPNKSLSHYLSSTSSIDSPSKISMSCSSSAIENESDSKVIVQMVPVVNYETISELLEGIKHSEDFRRAFESRRVIFDEARKMLTSRCNMLTEPVYNISSPENYSSTSEENGEVSDDLSSKNSLLSDDDSDNAFKAQTEDSEVQVSTCSNQDKDMIVNTDTIFRNKEYNSLGKGLKLGDIDYIAYQLRDASSAAVRILHYILFGNYGHTSNEQAYSEALEKIHQFNGYQFDEKSDSYQKKRTCLMNLPYPLLLQMHKVLLNSKPMDRIESVEALLKFLLEPSDRKTAHIETDEKMELSDETERLKKVAMQIPAVVVVKRLSSSYIQKMVENENIGYNGHSEKQMDFSETYKKPSFIHKGNGVQLKQFPDVVVNIRKVRKRLINVLHSLLYGRLGKDNVSRQNILEFSGFSTEQKCFLARGQMILNKLRKKELMQLCDIFSLRARSLNKGKKIKILLEFLQSPSKKQRKLKGTQRLNKSSVSDGLKESRNGDLTGGNSETPRVKIPDFVTSDLTSGNSEIPKVRLRDFDTICSNIECAAPDDLTELSDLLYVKPCDSSDIHQKLLEFTPFTFNMHSFEYHYRRTLMHHMNFETIKKIARILDIEDFHYSNTKQDLSMSVLKFLMEMKLPGKKKKSGSDVNSGKSQARPHILKFHSYQNDNQKLLNSRSHQTENFDSTYGSEELYDNEFEMDTSGPINHSSPKPSFSRFRHRKNGLTVKQEQILNDPTPLFDFLRHPTEKELISQIGEIINSSQSFITIGDLVKQVLSSYPDMNLYYRIDFIKNKALELLQEMRDTVMTFLD